MNLDFVEFQKWSKILCSDEGLFEAEMGELCSKLENIDGLYISINGVLVKFTEKSVSDWFDVPAEGYKAYIKGKAKVNINEVSNDE